MCHVTVFVRMRMHYCIMTSISPFISSLWPQGQVSKAVKAGESYMAHVCWVCINYPVMCTYSYCNKSIAARIASRRFIHWDVFYGDQCVTAYVSVESQHVLTCSDSDGGARDWHPVGCCVITASGRQLPYDHEAFLCRGSIHHFYSMSPAHTEPFMHSSHFKMLRRSGHVRREGIYWCQQSWNFFCQGTDILLADAASLLVVDNCFTIFSSVQHRPAATS